MQEKFKKMFTLFEIMTFAHLAGISLNYDLNTCDWQSTCYQTVLRFHFWLKQTVSNSIYLAIMENYDESYAVLISAVFHTHENVDSPKVF